MIHFYTAKRRERGDGWLRHQNDQVKLLCTKQYVRLDDTQAITVPWNVDCPECLRLLIPIQESRLEKMKQTLSIHSSPPDRAR